MEENFCWLKKIKKKLLEYYKAFNGNRKLLAKIFMTAMMHFILCSSSEHNFYFFIFLILCCVKNGFLSVKRFLHF